MPEEIPADPGRPAGIGVADGGPGRPVAVGRPAPFGSRLTEAVGRTGPLCTGIDPSPSLLEAWGLGDHAEGLRQFGERCVEAFAGVIPVVKPQVAFYERHGSTGMAALEALVRSARESGLLVLADAKRGDIANTTAAYAEAWLERGRPLAADAVTAFAYMGLGSLTPMFETARSHGSGVFVVVRGSNPEGRPLQEARLAGATPATAGPSVEDALLAGIAELNRAERTERSLSVGSVGAVIGATLAPSAFSPAEMGGPVLAPGVGAQGASASDVAALFGGCPVGSVLPSVSRSVLGAGPGVPALRRAAIRARDEMAAVLT